MHIIFGEEQVTALRDKYTILELDTIRFGQGGPEVPAFAVIENIGIQDLPLVESHCNMHNNLLLEYRKRNWNYCEQAIEQLVNTWGGELDSFYEELLSRVTKYKENDPGENWDWVIEKRMPAPQ
jgi:hypothetical protein